MSLLSTPEPSAPRRTFVVVLVLLLVAALGGASAYWMLHRPGPAAAPTTQPSVRPLPRRPPSAAPSPTPGPVEPGLARPTAPPRPAPLHVESDIPGARVFVDRKYVGTSPLDVRELSHGSHRVNVSVEGYEMYGEDVEIGDSPVLISVRFREVKLDESLVVIHKHGVGSCRGRLAATTEGLAFEPDSGNDGFRTGFDALERFDVDYLKKNLRLTVRDGRTYNFTVEGTSADPLLIFQTKVDAARKRLASGS